MYFVFASSHFFHIIMTYFFKVGFFFFVFCFSGSHHIQPGWKKCDASWEDSSSLVFRMSGATIDLTTVAMETCVSGVDWQLTQLEGWLTSKTAPFILCLYPPLNTENNAWHVTERLLTLNNTVFNSWMINCLSLRYLHCSPSLTFKTFQSFFWTFDPNYDGIIVELCHF